MVTKVHQPDKPVSVRRIESGPEDRAEFKRQWQEDRKHKEALKRERFAAIKERRKKNPPGSGGNGINIEIK